MSELDEIRARYEGAEIGPNEVVLHQTRVSAGQTLRDIRALLAQLRAAQAEVERLKAARKHGPVPRSECDLCQESVDPAGSDWEWVDDGWSLACKTCIQKILARAAAAPAKTEGHA